jgi:hypothetical protein
MTRATSAYTPAFPHRTGRRFGTAVIVERIMPVVYSPAIRRTPSTPIGSIPNMTPTRLVESGLNVALSEALIELQREAVAALAIIPKPIVRTTVTSSA